MITLYVLSRAVRAMQATLDALVENATSIGLKTLGALQALTSSVDQVQASVTAVAADLAVLKGANLSVLERTDDAIRAQAAAQARCRVVELHRKRTEREKGQARKPKPRRGVT